MYYLLTYNYVSDYLERRDQFRQEHLARAQKTVDDGTLILAGALAEPADKGMLIFKTDSPEPIKSFAENDPYVLNGLVSEWSVRPWNVVLGAGVDEIKLSI